jgi:UDP-glucose 4-epimerase
LFTLVERGAQLVIGDASEPDVIRDALADGHMVFHCAGGVTPALAEADPALDRESLLGPLATVLEVLAPRSGAMLTFVSSGGTVYGEPQHLPIGESHPTRPIGAYGRNRLHAERLIREWASTHAASTRIVRCSNAYGERQRSERGQGAVITLLENVLLGRAVRIFGDGSIIRDYVYIRDVAKAICALTHSAPRNLIVNVGTGRGTSLTQLIATIESATMRTALVDRAPARSFDVGRNVLDIRRLRELVKFRPLPLGWVVRRLAERTANGEPIAAGPTAAVHPTLNTG